MPDPRYYKLSDNYKNKKHETKSEALQRFIEMIELYIEHSENEPGDWIAYPLLTQEPERKAKKREDQWGLYNRMVGAAIRIWEKYPGCSKPPADNPNPLNGLKTLLIWATEEQKDAGANAGYIVVDIATRTITIGTEPTTITSERVWDFIKDLVSAAKSDRLVPVSDGEQNNKNNFDQLRRKVGGTDNLKKLVVSARDGYKLSPAVKLLNSGQVGIRRTDRKRLRAT